MERVVLVFALVVSGLGLYLLSDRTAGANKLEPIFDVGFDSCRNVRFKVTNDRNVAIEIKQVKFYNASKGNWRTEDVGGDDSRCERGVSCTVGGTFFDFQGEDLAGAEGARLTKIVFVFKDVNSSTIYESRQFEPTDPVCRVDKVYGHGQGWSIGGTSDAVDQNSSNGLGDACKNVSFLVRNDTSRNIFVSKVKFFNRNSGKWKTEDVTEVECPSGGTTACTIGGRDDLSDAKDDDITKIYFIYKEDLGYNQRGGRERSEAKESKVFAPSSPKCKEGKVFGTGQGWTIKDKNR